MPCGRRGMRSTTAVACVPKPARGRSAVGKVPTWSRGQVLAQSAGTRPIVAASLPMPRDLTPPPAEERTATRPSAARRARRRCSPTPHRSSNDAVAVSFQQAIGASDALRTGSYAKTPTFTPVDHDPVTSRFVRAGDRSVAVAGSAPMPDRNAGRAGPGAGAGSGGDRLACRRVGGGRSPSGRAAGRRRGGRRRRRRRRRRGTRRSSRRSARRRCRVGRRPARSRAAVMTARPSAEPTW